MRKRVILAIAAVLGCAWAGAAAWAAANSQVAGLRRLSEQEYRNSIADIFGKDIAVQPRREDSTLIGAFQRTVSAAGCLFFTTVLDPESDAAHETHFHLDVLERKGGYRYCH